VDPSIRVDAHQILVVGGVVDLAQRKPIGDHREPQPMRVREDVRRVQELGVPECAHGAATLVGPDDLAAELGLMKPDSRSLLGVAPLVRLQIAMPGQQSDALVESDVEEPLVRAICDDVNGEDRDVDACGDLAEKQEGATELKCKAELTVVPVRRPAPVGIMQETTSGLFIVIGPVGGGKNAQGTGHPPGVPDAPRLVDEPVRRTIDVDGLEFGTSDESAVSFGQRTHLSEELLAKDLLCHGVHGGELAMSSYFWARSR
jgi:hypothetical protein